MSCGNSKQQLKEAGITALQICIAPYRNSSGEIVTCNCPFSEHANEVSSFAMNQKIVTVRYESKTTFLVNFKRGENILKSAIDTALSGGLPLGTRKRGSTKEINYQAWRITNLSGALILTFDTLENVVCLSLDSKLSVDSASEWDQTQLDKLKIAFQPVTFEVFLQKMNVDHEVCLEEIKPLLQRLSYFSRDTFDLFATKGKSPGEIDLLRSNRQLHDPLVKACYLAQHYATAEGIVDSLMNELFRLFGFFEETLYPFPQLKMKLFFNHTVTRDAKADFTIMDVLSFYRIAVFEEKNFSELSNSEPQLIAAGIALQQMNLRMFNPSSSHGKVSYDIMDVTYAIRVHGYYFYFYLIPGSPAILNAMDTGSSATDTTEVLKLGDDCGLNLLDPDDRSIIFSIFRGLRKAMDFYPFKNTLVNSDSKVAKHMKE